jgi:RNA polymerase sigma factor (sigma-70 family)
MSRLGRHPTESAVSGIRTTLPLAETDFDNRVNEIAPRLLAYFARRIRPQEDAADCLSETLLVIWRRRSKMPVDVDESRAWFFGIAKRVLANQHRSNARRNELAEKLRIEVERLPKPAFDVDPEIREALDALPANDRELVLLVAWDGCGVAEAGALLGLKPEASRARYSRARLRLRQLLSS